MSGCEWIISDGLEEPWVKPPPWPTSGLEPGDFGGVIFGDHAIWFTLIFPPPVVGGQNLYSFDVRPNTFCFACAVRRYLLVISTVYFGINSIVFPMYTIRQGRKFFWSHLIHFVL